MEKELFKGQQILQMLNKQIFKDPKLPCESGNIIESMCLNPNCQSALFCHKKQCKPCSNAHTSCKTMLLNDVTVELNKRVKDHRQFIMKMVQIDNTLIDQLKRSQKEIVKRYHFQDLAIEHQAIVNKLYRRKNTNVTGNDIRQFELALRNLNKESNREKAAQVLEEYRKEMNAITDKVTRLKLEMPGAEKLEHTPLLDSIVLNRSKNIFQKLKFMIPEIDHPEEFQLLYRASEHEFSGEAFHIHCNNIKDTLTLVRTEFGKTIVGFSHYKWNEVGNGWGVEDSRRKTCLFQLDNFEKFLPISDQNLIYNEEKAGPVFGTGHDLYISNNCNKNIESYAKICSTYCPNEDIKSKYPKGSASYKRFAGAQYFKVEEYEVYKVIYKLGDQKADKDSCEVM